MDNRIKELLASINTQIKDFESDFNIQLKEADVSRSGELNLVFEKKRSNIENFKGDTKSLIKDTFSRIEEQNQENKSLSYGVDLFAERFFIHNINPNF